VPGESTLLLLGDNITFGHGLGTSLRGLAEENPEIATCFVTEVNDPKNFGVVTLVDGLPVRIDEKPKQPKSSLAVIGIYHLPADSFDRLNSIAPSLRGELEITDLLDDYLQIKRLSVKKLSRGTAWLDAGTSKSMLEAANFVNIIEERQGLLVGSPHEAALRTGLISKEEFDLLVRDEGDSDYFEKLKMLTVPVELRRKKK
jgi:glucose-1-phosphate thymidylyltransferase